MFGDTLDLEIDTVVETHVKIKEEGYSGEYRLGTSLNDRRVTIRHSKTNPKNGQTYDRHNVEILDTVFAAGDVPEYQRKIYLVIEQLPSDIDTNLAEALAEWMTPANLAKLVNWES